MQVRYCWIPMVPQVDSLYGAASVLHSRRAVSREAVLALVGPAAFVALAGEPNGVTAANASVAACGRAVACRPTCRTAARSRTCAKAAWAFDCAGASTCAVMLPVP